eukprot:15003443-Alexandrium_andersonii.AAC.1
MHRLTTWHQQHHHTNQHIVGADRAAHQRTASALSMTAPMPPEKLPSRIRLAVTLAVQTKSERLRRGQLGH